MEKNWITFLIILSLISIAGFVVVGRLAAVVGGRYAMYGEGGEDGFSIMALDNYPFLLWHFCLRRLFLLIVSINTSYV